jgi:ankyrin repeat protein
MMILANADVNYKVGKGDPVLHLACEEGKLDKVVFLIKNGATLLRTNASNENCLFVALPHPIIVNILCRQASENNQLIKMVRSTDANGNTAIHRCAQGGHFESLERIIQSLNATKTKDDIAEILADQDKTKNNDTCLHMAAANGHVEVVRYILDVCKSVQLDLQRFENRHGDTPLHSAVRAKRGECVLLLKNSDKKGKVQKHKNYEKLTPKALAEHLNVGDIWNFTVEEAPVSPSMLDRLFRRKQSLVNVKEVKV